MTRRVGIFTLGISFLVIGIIIPLALLYPDYAMKLIQLSPLLLVGLGVEILYYAITFKSDGTQKLHYDGLSIFIVLFITIATIGASIIVPFTQNLIANERKLNAVRSEISDVIYDKMETNKYEGYVSVYRNNGMDFWISSGDSDLEIGYGLSLELNFDQAKTKEEVAAVVYNLISDLDKRIESVGITANCDADHYYGTINRGSLRNVTEKKISSQIHLRKDYNNNNNNNSYGENYTSDSSDVSSSSSDVSSSSSDVSSSSSDVSSDQSNSSSDSI